MLRNYPLDPIGQNLLLSKWQAKGLDAKGLFQPKWSCYSLGFSPPPHLKHSKKVLFLSIFSKAWEWLSLVLWEQAAGGNQTRYVHPCPLAHCRTPVPRFDREMSLHEFAIEPHFCKTTIWGFFWRYWHQSMGCKIMCYLFSLPDHKMGFRIGCFLKWRIFYWHLAPCSPWCCQEKEITITVLLINLSYTSGAHTILASWPEGERWVVWCR